MKVMARPARTLRGYFRSAGFHADGRPQSPSEAGARRGKAKTPAEARRTFLDCLKATPGPGRPPQFGGVAASAAVERGGQGVEVAAVLIDVVFEQLFQKRRHPKAQHHGIADLVAVAILGK